MSRARDSLLEDLDLLGFEREVRFRGLSGTRRFKFDTAYVSPDGETMVAVDYHGWGSGAGHMWRNKQSGDHEKLSEAQLCGWTYIVCDALNVSDGRCWTWIMAALEKGDGYVDEGVSEAVDLPCGEATDPGRER